ncbi:hypothetical protein EVAR_87094_1 [Eumeta japonica]|uniref:Uncharacterized protein n=1 Tax=Eumeta variegata TaxID=151549 RepID=A0A4C1VQB5_EUMVA|nr:hypothetical protein EVAR_87094_1 [Eumeta japonica]
MAGSTDEMPYSPVFRREVASFTVGFRPLSDSSGGPLPLYRLMPPSSARFLPSDILFLSKKSAMYWLLFLRLCMAMSGGEYVLVALNEAKALCYHLINAANAVKTRKRGDDNLVVVLNKRVDVHEGESSRAQTALSS